MTRSMNHSLVNNVYMNNENDNSKNLKHIKLGIKTHDYTFDKENWKKKKKATNN